jgi:phage gp37-like protein
MAHDLWTTVEDAVVTALKAELDAQVKTLATYQGDWQTDLHREDWRFPAVLVQLRQSRGEQVTIGSYDLNLEFTVLVMVRHLRGEAAGRRDADGVYQLLAGVRKALAPGPGAGAAASISSGRSRY